MTDNVVDFDAETRLEIAPEKVLDGAKERVETCLVIGWDNDGMFYFASSTPDSREMLWLLESAKRELMGLAYD